jgi:hypothetical protein
LPISMASVRIPIVSVSMPPVLQVVQPVSSIELTEHR